MANQGNFWNLTEVFFPRCDPGVMGENTLTMENFSVTMTLPWYLVRFYLPSLKSGNRKTCQHICGKVKVKMRAKKYPKTQYSHYVFLFVMEFSTMRLVIKVIDTFICLYSVQIMQCIISSVMTTCVVWKHVYHYTLNFKIFCKWLFVNVSIFGKFL